jgi:plastocyanin
VGKRYLPWMACAAVALVGAPALAASGPADPPSTAALVAHDAPGAQGGLFQDSSQADPNDHTVGITTGGTVTFSYPSGTGVHNVTLLAGSPEPTNCNQTKQSPAAGGMALDEDGKLPMPGYLPEGWEGVCTFPTAGTYSFVCGLHAAMTATVVVTNPTATVTATETATATASPEATAVLPAATVSPTPVATAVSTPAPAPVLAPKISTASFKRSKRTLTVAGTTSATGKVKVELSYRVGKKSIKKTLSIAIKSGTFSGTLKLSATDAKQASKLSVSVSATGSPAAKKTVSVKK